LEFRLSKSGQEFSAFRIYEVPKGWVPNPERLERAVYVPAMPTQEISFGFVPPRSTGEPGDWPFLEVVSGLHIIRFRVQTRSVPKSAVDRLVAERSKKHEAESGRRPGKLLRKEFADDARQALLPQAFPRDAETWGLVCPARGILIVSSPSLSVRMPQEMVAVHTGGEAGSPVDHGSVKIGPIRLNTSVQAFMVQALTDPDAVAPFGPATMCVLCEAESKRRVSYKNHEIADNPEIKGHLTRGHEPTRLGMYLDNSAHFEIDNTLGFHKLTFMGDLFGQHQANDQADDAFDADFTLIGGGLLGLYDKLINLLGVTRWDDVTAQSTIDGV
jgi:recombination associated protein RdgC